MILYRYVLKESEEKFQISLGIVSFYLSHFQPGWLPVLNTSQNHAQFVPEPPQKLLTSFPEIGKGLSVNATVSLSVMFSDRFDLW